MVNADKVMHRQMIDIQVVELIEHPERLSKDTLFGLRELVARYPYYQAARLLFLQNLFLLHDPSFGDELRKAALYIPDRRVIFEMVEGKNYEIQRAPREEQEENAVGQDADRTGNLIDKFLNGSTGWDDGMSGPVRKVTADPTKDYVAYLMQMEDAEPEAEPEEKKGQRSNDLLDDFLEKQNDRIQLQDKPEYVPEAPQVEESEENALDECYFTETLAKIYIKQGRYEKAMEIIRKLNLNYPKKNSYFADQIRFLQKLIINNKYKK